MTEEELNAFRKNIALNESSTVWLEKKMLSHIDEQASQIAYWQKCYNDLVVLNVKEEGACKLALDAKDKQIATLKTTCIKERFWQIWNAGECQTVERATQKAKDQLAKEYPEIFAEE